MFRPKNTRYNAVARLPFFHDVDVAKLCLPDLFAMPAAPRTGAMTYLSITEQADESTAAVRLRPRK
jgi:hypothetical protein